VPSIYSVHILGVNQRWDLGTMWTGSYTPALVHCMPCESFEYNTNSLAYGSPNYTRHQRGRTLPTMFPLSCALAHAHTTFRLACTAFSYWRTIGIGHECYCSRGRPMRVWWNKIRGNIACQPQQILSRVLSCTPGLPTVWYHNNRGASLVRQGPPLPLVQFCPTFLTRGPQKHYQYTQKQRLKIDEH